MKFWQKKAKGDDKTRKSLWARLDEVAWRPVLLISAVVVFGAGVFVWIDGRQRQVEATKTTTVMQRKVLPAGLKKPNKTAPLIPRKEQRRNWPARVVSPVRQQVTSVTDSKPASDTGNGGLVLGLMGLASGLMLAGIFFPRLSEFGFLGVTMKLLPAMADVMGTVAERTSSVDDFDRVKNAILAKIKRRMAEGGTLDEEFIQAAMSDALREHSYLVPADEVQVDQTARGPRVTIVPPAGLGRPLEVTTEEQFVLGGFPDAVRRTLRRADVELGRVLFARSLPEEDVLAALVYEIPADLSEPLHVTDIVQNPQAPVPAEVASLQLLLYLEVVNEKVGAAGILYRPREELDVDQMGLLDRLGFEPEPGPEPGAPDDWRYKG